MNRSKERSGFTLIEILVVLIIVGVLAAIALPNLFGNVARSKAHEGLTSLSLFKTMLEACLNGNCGSEGTKCNGMSVAVTTNFTYHFKTDAVNTACPTSGISAATPAIYAGGVAAQGFDELNDIITLTRSSTGTWTCTGAGKFLGVC